MTATSATSEHLIGPTLLIRIVHKQSKAVAWMQSVSEPRCVLSPLANCQVNGACPLRAHCCREDAGRDRQQSLQVALVRGCRRCA